MNDFEKAAEDIGKAMSLIDGIPEDMYPVIDDYISNAYNNLDDALCSLQSAIDWGKEMMHD